jgi:hypothetical protein
MQIGLNYSWTQKVQVSCSKLSEDSIKPKEEILCILFQKKRGNLLYDGFLVLLSMMSTLPATNKHWTHIFHRLSVGGSRCAQRAMECNFFALEFHDNELIMNIIMPHQDYHSL